MPRAGLDTDAVVRAASDLADREGLEAVTLARLAKDLGVRTPSLYNHVDGLAAVHRALALKGMRLANARMGRAAVGVAGDEALIAIANAYREFATQHPGLYAASLRAPAAGDAELAAAGAETVGTVTAVLAGYGLGGEDALHATRGLRAIIHGFVALEMAGGFGLPLDLQESFTRLLKAFARGLAGPAPAARPG